MPVRRATADDLPALVGLQPIVHDLHRERYPDLFRELDPDAVAGCLGGLLRADDTLVWAAEHDGAVVGFLVAQLRDFPDTPYTFGFRCLHVDQVVVHPDHRRRGHGGALLQAAIDEADARGIRRLELDSYAFNGDAHAAFEAAGFEPRAIRFWRRR